MTDAIDTNLLVSRFEQQFGATPRIFVAPGRINIIGEHVDYCGGAVLPAAINKACYVACAPNGLDHLQVISSFGEALLPLDVFTQNKDWRDYVGGIAHALIQGGFPVVGHDLIIESNVPIGAGVSSSAAIEVAVGLALSGGLVSGPRLAQLAQIAENKYVGMNCGIMDQFASANGVAGHALLLDCASLQYEAISVPKEAHFLLIDSGVKHSHVDGEYASRRHNCETAAKALGVGLLCEVTDLAMLNSLSGNPAKRARHVVSEIARTQRACAALVAGDLPLVGTLMNQSHESLSMDMEVSTPQVDILAKIAQGTAGVYGARMMGGGFGGSVIALVDPLQLNTLRPSILREYQAATGKVVEAFDVALEQGAHEVFV